MLRQLPALLSKLAPFSPLMLIRPFKLHVHSARLLMFINGPIIAHQFKRSLIASTKEPFGVIYSKPDLLPLREEDDSSLTSSDKLSEDSLPTAEKFDLTVSYYYSLRVQQLADFQDIAASSESIRIHQRIDLLWTNVSSSSSRLDLLQISVRLISMEGY